jgi:UDP-N-acetylglucosamine--N-acetylmuramyl-(pentapeptide) pyrophosphoryl-undecaprenol N-acetylglucosamine transferase
MRVLFAAGGTGGHLYPALALAEALRDEAEIAFVGTAERMEARLVPSAGFPFFAVSAAPAERRWWRALRAVLVNLRGVVQAASVVVRERPDVVVATGGYVCVPVVLAAWVLRATCVHRAAIALLEPNAMLGSANRLLLPLADEIWGSGPFPAQRRFIRTGVPVRAALRALPPRDDAVRRLGIDPQKKTLLAMGGSQGARTINDAVVELARSRRVPDGWQIVLIAGEREFARIRNGLPVSGAVVGVPYLREMADAYAVADLVLARAGASTLAELAAVGRPAILVPYPHAAGDHQAANAEAVARSGAAVVVSDRDFDAGRLEREWRALAEPARYAAALRAARGLAGGDATAAVTARIRALAQRKRRA